jgi:hypothetical protein
MANFERLQLNVRYLKIPMHGCNESLELWLRSRHKASDLMASSETIECCRKVAIERAHGLTPQTFHQRYLSGYEQPMIIKDAVKLPPPSLQTVGRALPRTAGHSGPAKQALLQLSLLAYNWGTFAVGWSWRGRLRTGCSRVCSSGWL